LRIKIFNSVPEEDIVTSLSRDECIRRLREHTDPAWKIWGQPVIGNFGKSAIFLRKRKYYSNPLQPILRINVDYVHGKTLIRSRFEVNTLIRVIILIWMTLFLFIGGAFASLSIYDLLLSDAPLYARDIFGIFCFISVLSLASTIYRFGKWLSRKDQAYLLNFVRSLVL